MEYLDFATIMVRLTSAFLAGLVSIPVAAGVVVTGIGFLGAGPSSRKVLPSWVSRLLLQYGLLEQQGWLLELDTICWV
jgi:hypothetical protein